MGGKSRKTGGLSKRLVMLLKQRSENKNNLDCGKKKPKTDDQYGFDFTPYEDEKDDDET